VLEAIVGKNAMGKFYKAIINYFVIFVFGFLQTDFQQCECFSTMLACRMLYLSAHSII
jgi:hypothetical protein